MEFLLSQLQNENAVVVQKSAELSLLFLYVISYFITKKAAFFAAFFIDVLLSNSYMASHLSEPQYYFMIVGIYSAIYFYLVNCNYKKKTVIAYGTIVIFYMGMAIDAQVNRDIETFMYTYYVHFVVSFHISIIISLINWRVFRTRLGAIIDRFLDILRHSDSVTFICYNSGIKQTNRHK